ncbi:hypothetical protein [Streptomyces turgidiscabies]|uniref:hypothetical protein n=1 Tax=Streptomyces turgidiscabies TaxID=85558 RepID=UPI0038F72C51
MTPQERRDLFKRTRASKQTQYGVELWTRDGVRICEITPYVQNLYWVEERNEAEVLQFSMDLDVFERYMINSVGADPVSNFREGQTEIKIKEKRGNGPWVYLFGTQLFYAPINLNNDGSATIGVNAEGYLNFFKDRYPDPAVKYTGVESVQISRNLITQAQSVANGNYGIILPGSGYYTTTKNRDRSFEQYTSSTKLNIQRLTALVDGTFDFKFLADKTYMTYPAIGSPRTDFRISFDRANFRSTVDSAVLNRGANNLFNLIHGIGSGFGADQLITHQSDLASQVEFKVRELPVQFNEVKDSTTLIENAQARLERVKKLLRMPQYTMSGADLPDNRLEIGDIVPVVMTGRRLLEDLTGLYRVERMEVHVDDNHFLQAVTPYFEKTGDYA